MRAIIGISLGVMLFYGYAPWKDLATPRILAMKTDIEAARPGARLDAMLTPLLAGQNGTAAPK
jgi:hypothetical protein